MPRLASIVALLALAALAHAAVDADLITYLPGLIGVCSRRIFFLENLIGALCPKNLYRPLAFAPGFGTPATRQYSGYLNVDAVNGRNLHYWFVTAENATANTPVMLCTF
jgi:hypothetical protein